jgi:hypothetical protein
VLHRLLDAPDDASGLLQSSRLAAIDLVAHGPSRLRASLSRG